MREIRLTQGKTAIVDDADFDELSKYKWHIHGDSKTGGYAARSCHGKVVLMSRQILGLTDPKIFADHINGNTLDNRRENLRACTPQQNMWNKVHWRTSPYGFRGICIKAGKYEARVFHNGERISVGLFGTPQEAARAYDEKVRELRGEFARTNF